MLGAATLQTLDAALAAYEATRLPMATHVQRASSVAGKMFEFNDALADKYEQLGPAIGANWDFLTQSTPESESIATLERFWNRIGEPNGEHT